jgi:hypothetical protein
MLAMGIAAWLTASVCDAQNAGPNFFSSWFARVAAIQSQQPAWMTSVFTTTPRLDEEIHYDASFENSKGAQLRNYGSGKGLELIPYYNMQLNISIPTYEVQGRNRGVGDESFLFKYRIATANEQEGNYVLTAFLGFTAPTGDAAFTGHHYGFTPTIAGGKGWGRFDFQSTLGVSIPDDLTQQTGPGISVPFNTVLQYKVGDVIWPAVEFNDVWFANGVHEGKDELFISPEVIFGRFPIWERLRMVVGAGYQIAITDSPLYRNLFDVTVRFPF